MRLRTSDGQAWGLMSLSFAVPMSVYITAARSPPRSEPANSHGLRPRQSGLSARSASPPPGTSCVRHARRGSHRRPGSRRRLRGACSPGRLWRLAALSRTPRQTRPAPPVRDRTPPPGRSLRPLRQVQGWMDEGVRDCDNVMGMLLMSAVGWSYSAASYRVSRSDLALWLRVRRTAGNGDYASRRYHAGHTLISGVFTIACFSPTSATRHAIRLI